MASERPARLLLVEDDVAQRRVLAGFLRKAGHEVLEAGSAAQALDRSREHEIDLLITDLRLGGPDGIELLHDLRRDHPDVQAIVVTAYGTVEDALRAMVAKIESLRRSTSDGLPPMP
mgnify:CR=1 FL=1